ncbi:MAG: hypothetical protein N2486_07430 [Caloramator sp.]|nr:hypothetical protein [Caloramator sp.]
MDNQNLLAAIEELLDKKLEPINNKLDNMEKKLNAVLSKWLTLQNLKPKLKKNLITLEMTLTLSNMLHLRIGMK